MHNKDLYGLPCSRRVSDSARWSSIDVVKALSYGKYCCKCFKSFVKLYSYAVLFKKEHVGCFTEPRTVSCPRGLFQKEGAAC